MTELEEAAREELIHSYSNSYVGNTVYGNEAMLNMFRKGAEWQSKQSPWISVEERYPLDYDNKLIRLTDGTIRLALFDSDDDGNFWYDQYASESFSLNDVTHWMEIPQ